MFTNIKQTETEEGTDIAFVESEANAILEASFKKIQNYIYKMRYESGYLFRKRKEITTNYTF
jgi:hypothetical protein